MKSIRISGKRKLLVVGALLCLFVSAPAQQTEAPRSLEAGAPRFEDFGVAVWRGRVAPLDLRSHSLARMYRTVLRQQLREEGVNFAGHYTLAGAGCGTGCSIRAIIDARTGRAYFPGELYGWTSIIGDDSALGEDYELVTQRPDSRLLRIIGRPAIGRANEERHGPGGIYYYEWTNNRLRLVRFIPVGSYPEADPPGRP